MRENFLRIKVSQYEFLLYLILVPFLCPKGFMEFSQKYRLFFTIWLYCAMVLILTMFLSKVFCQKMRYKHCILIMILYYLTFILITFLVQGSITEGTQKMFAAPALCLLCAMCLKNKPAIFIKCVGDILIVNFFLNISVFSPLFWNEYFDVGKHIIFLGHVQVASQFGILGVFISYLLKLDEQKKKASCLLTLSIITMLASGTAASFIAVGLLLFFYVFRKELITANNTFFKTGMIITVFVGLNLMCAFLLEVVKYGTLNSIFTAVTNGRTFIWREGLNLMNGHWLWGYGAYGVQIKVFWSPEGMNYAHNEMLQRLLDGGIILTVLFILLLYAYTKNIRKAHNKQMIYWASAMLLIILVIMLFESVTEYYYYFILLSLMAYLPEIELMTQKRMASHGNNIKSKVDVL